MTMTVDAQATPGPPPRACPLRRSGRPAALAVDAASRRQLVGEALAQLPAGHRALIARTFYQGCTTAQLADDLQLSESTVTTRLHDAVRELLHALREKGLTA